MNSVNFGSESKPLAEKTWRASVGALGMKIDARRLRLSDLYGFWWCLFQISSLPPKPTGILPYLKKKSLFVGLWRIADTWTNFQTHECPLFFPSATWQSKNILASWCKSISVNKYDIKGLLCPCIIHLCAHLPGLELLHLEWIVPSKQVSKLGRHIFSVNVGVENLFKCSTVQVCRFLGLFPGTLAHRIQWICFQASAVCYPAPLGVAHSQFLES